MATIRRKTGENPEDFRDFRVRKNHIRQWLLFFKKYSSSYSHIIIAEDRIENLPVDDNIFHLIPTVNPNNAKVLIQNQDVNINGGIEQGPGQLQDIGDNEEMGIHESLIGLPAYERNSESNNVES